jgi:uncharacterized protein
MTTIQLTDGIQLFSGAFFNYNDPGSSDVTIEDIAHALSNVCRFAGHVSHFYSVAQHAVNCSLIVPEEHAFSALMHDTAEAFTNDLPTPLKTAIPIFKELEVSIETAMGKRFGFQYPLSPEVRLADLQMLKLEKEALKPHASGNWEVLDGIEIGGLEQIVNLGIVSPTIAKNAFLQRYRELAPALPLPLPLPLAPALPLAAAA